MMKLFMGNPVAALTIILMVLALVLALVRVLRGPGTPDRVVAADTASVVITASLAGIALLLGRSLYLDIALVFAALAFVGVIAIAKGIEPPAEGGGK